MGFMDIITSDKNGLIKKIRKLATVRGRAVASSFIIEGSKFIAEAGSEWKIIYTVVSETYALNYNVENQIVVSDKIFEGLTDTVNPQGILAVVEKREFSVCEVLGGKNPLVFVLEDINDPGNLGTILRNCHGLGVTGVILAGNTTDVYSPKTVRASAGSIFHIPFVHINIEEVAAELKNRNIPLYATSPAGDVDLHNLNLQSPAAIMLGNEHHGLTQQAMDLANTTVRIPVMSESLNVSVACAVFAYEAWRQRNV